MDILILRNSVSSLDENNVLFANAFIERGDNVYFGIVNSINTISYKVHAKIIKCDEKIQALGDSLETNELVNSNIEGFDLIWVMNQPHHLLSRDVWQILWMLSKRAPFVNSIESINYLNNKNNLGLVVPEENLVENIVDNEFTRFWSVFDKRSDEKWVLKPTNSGCGADVYILDESRNNAKSLLQSMTGNTTAVTEISGENLLGVQNKYAVLQKYAPEVAKGEKRVLLAGGDIVAFHGRELVEGDHRSNITQGGSFLQSELSEEEIRMCEIIGRNLLEYGVNYIGLDISYPYVLELNIVNPGGMYGTLQVTGTDNSLLAIEKIIKNIKNNLKSHSL